jgi:hypothetical protein
LLLRRFSGAGGWYDTCASILALTKMDWNNNTLYKKLPVTLVYSKAFADIVQQNPNIVDDIYDVRRFGAKPRKNFVDDQAASPSS